MLGWFARKSRSSVSPHSRLVLESLEQRLCLDGDPLQMPAPPVAPTLTCTLTYLTQRMIRIQGVVTDDNPANAVVNFTGDATGSVTVQNNGAFSVDLTATQIGGVTAVATDADNHQSNSTLFELSSNPPAIVGFAAVCNDFNLWTFSGHVNDESAVGLRVNFGGAAALNGQSVLVDSDGNFSITVQLPAHPTGTAWASTTDWWSLDSNEAIYRF